jgi:SAM-dependent methyltransferase
MGAIREFELAGWRSAAAAYEACFAGATRPYVEALLAAVGLRPGMRLLDIACGTGVAAAEALRRGARASGLDFSPEMLAQATKLHRDVDLREGDAEHLPFDDGAFDVAVSNFGVHHCERPQDAMAEAHRVLRPGGCFAFTLWVKPKDNPAWRLVQEAVAAHGRLDVPMGAGSDDRHALEHYVALAVGGGFGAGNVAGAIVDRTWTLPTGADVVAAFERGTVRMATLLRGQSPEALRAIREHVAKSIRGHARPDAIVLPTRAFLIRALKQV